jgi:anti-sigma factor RsiW
MSCTHTVSVSAYALGTLDPTERAELSRHLEGCPECRAVLESVAGLPGLLARVRPEHFEAEPVVADEEMFQRLLAATVRERRHRRRFVTMAAAAAAVAVLGTATGLAVANRAGTHADVTAAAAQGPVHARLWLRPTAAGTRVTLKLSGVPAHEKCELVAIDSAGHREVAATWDATYEGVASVTGSVAFPTSRLQRFVVQTLDDRQLVVVPMGAARST